jgi:hypothetical protein
MFRDILSLAVSESHGREADEAPGSFRASLQSFRCAILQSHRAIERRPGA